jgi:hypothetical protein
MKEVPDYKAWYQQGFVDGALSVCGAAAIGVIAFFLWRYTK